MVAGRHIKNGKKSWHAVNVWVGKNIKQPAGRGEYRSDIIYIGSGHYVVVADRRRCDIVLCPRRGGSGMCVSSNYTGRR